MIVLVLIAVWIFVFALVVGLCAAARTGDVQLVGTSSTAGRGRLAALAWEPAGEVRAQASTRTRSAPSPDAGVRLTRSDGVAA